MKGNGRWILIMQYTWRGIWLWSFLLVAVAVVFAQVAHQGLSGDVYWQWAAGRWMLRTHQVLKNDPFSYTLYHHPWVAEEWGYEVLLAGSIAALGPVALWLFSAGLGSLTLFVTWVRLRAHSDDGIKAGLVLILIAVSLELFVKDRPQTLSYLLFALVLWILESSGQHPWRRLVLIPLLWFWVLCHGSFLLGYLLVATDLGLAAVVSTRVSGQRNLGLRTAVLAAAILASWVNPFGWRLWSYAWHVSTSTVIANSIVEWQSPNFHNDLLKLVIWLPALALAAVWWRHRPGIPWFATIWAAILFLATLQSVRFLPYFSLEWGIAVLVGTQGWRFRQVKPWIVAPVLLAISLIVVVSKPIIRPDQASSSEPVAAVNYLKSKPANARVFNYYVWGGYLIWRGIRVFIDGRTDFYLQDGIFTQYMAIQNLTVNPDIEFRQWRVQYVLWPPFTPLATYLLADPSWRLVYQTKHSWLFKHRGGWGPAITVPSVKISLAAGVQ